MFLHEHPYPPFIPKGATKLIVGTLPPPRFSMGKLKKGDVNFCYGSIDGQLWKILNKIFKLELTFETSDFAIQQRKDFLIKNNIGICDIVASCERQKMDASDIGMENIQLRDMGYFLKKNSKVHTLLLTGGNSKNGPEYHLRNQLKEKGIPLVPVSHITPRIHEFIIENKRKIEVISLTAPSGSANRAIGSNPVYKALKNKNPAYNTLDFRIAQYKPYFINIRDSKS
jgi:G:T/U-mismatch repair DNA glycosylase